MVAPNPDTLPLLDTASLRAALGAAGADCKHCKGLSCPGWESLSAPLGPPQLEAVGTLRDPALDEPTVVERHATGTPPTHYWHPRAPVSTSHFPYNRCSVWRCPQCRRGFVQYTEAGGYYVDHRIREVDPTLIED